MPKERDESFTPSSPECFSQNSELRLSQIQRAILMADDATSNGSANDLAASIKQSLTQVDTILVDSLPTDDECMQSICEAAFANPCVKTLQIGGIAMNYSSRIITWVALTRSVETLILDSIDMDNSDPLAILEVLMLLERLECLKLQYIRESDVLLQAVSEYLPSNTLKVLDLKYCDITDRETTFHSLDLGLCRNKSLVRFSLSNRNPASGILSGLDEFLGNAIKTHHSLQSLFIAVSDISTTNYSRLLNALTVSSSLTKVTIEGLVLDSDVSLAAARLIRCNNSMQQLDLCFIHRFDSRRGDLDSMTAPMMRALARNSSLKSIRVIHCSIATEDGVLALCYGLENNKTLESLSLTRRFKSTELIRLLSYSLARNTTLKHLELTSCGMNDDEVCVLCNGLGRTDTLESLTLDYNSITDIGAASLADLIAANTSLSLLSMDNNLFGHEGISHIGTALKQNSTLKSINLSNPQGRMLDDDCARTLLDGIKGHHSLTHVYLPMGLTENQQDELFYYLQRNQWARRALDDTPWTLWPLILKRADSCRIQEMSPPLVGFFTIRKFRVIVAVG